MKEKLLILWSYIFSIIIIPLYAQFIGVLIIYGLYVNLPLETVNRMPILIGVIIVALACAMMFIGFLYGRFMPLGWDFRLRYIPFLFPLFYLFIIGTITSLSAWFFEPQYILSLFWMAMTPYLDIFNASGGFTGYMLLFSGVIVVIYGFFLLAYVCGVKRRGVDLLLGHRSRYFLFALFIVLSVMFTLQYQMLELQFTRWA